MTRTAEDFQAPSPKPESKSERSPTPPPTEKRSMPSSLPLLLSSYHVFITDYLIFNVGIIPQVYVKHPHQELFTIRTPPPNDITHLEQRRVPSSSNRSRISHHQVGITGMEPITFPISPPAALMHPLDFLYLRLEMPRMNL